MALSRRGVSRFSWTYEGPLRVSDPGHQQEKTDATDQLRELPPGALVLAAEPTLYPLLIPLGRLCLLRLPQHHLDRSDLNLRLSGIARRGVHEGSLHHGRGEEDIFRCKCACRVLTGARSGRLRLLLLERRGVS